MGVIIHPRVKEHHPELSDEDVLSAWNNTLAYLPRLGSDAVRYIAVGFDGNGRLIKIVAQRSFNGDWVIFHAMTPPSKKTLVELRLIKR